MRKYPEVTTLMSPKIASHEPTAIKRDPSQDTDGEPVLPILGTLSKLLQEIRVNRTNQRQACPQPSVVKINIFLISYVDPLGSKNRLPDTNN